MRATSIWGKFRKVILQAALVAQCLALLSGCTHPSPDFSGTPSGTGSPAEATMLSTTASPSATLRPEGVTEAPSVTHTPAPSALPTTESPAGTPQETLAQPSPTPLQPAQVPTHYTLDAVFDYWQGSVSVTETISYQNLSADSLSDLVLVVEPNLVPGGFSLNSIAWQGGQPVDTYQLDGNQLKISLPQSLAPGETLELNLSYGLIIPQIGTSADFNGPIAYGYSSRQTNLVDWYPYIPPYANGQGWLVHRPWWLGEYQVYDIADFDVTIQLAESVKDFVMAASAPATQDGDRYTYHLAAARTFAASASTEYVVQTTTAGDVTVISYSFPYDKYSAQEALHNTADALQLYSELFQPYPRSTLSVVEADFLDGMEYDALFFLSYGFYDVYDGTPKGYLTFIAAHETAHQWWYSLVGNDQALEPWLDESLCTYMEKVFYERVYPDYKTDSGMSLVNYWWYYRVGFYHPQGAIGSTIYDYQDFISYRNAVYLNGAKFLDALRKLIGDEAFFASLHEYAARYSGRLATTQDLFTIIRAHTSEDLDGLISTYFEPSQ